MVSRLVCSKCRAVLVDGTERALLNSHSQPHHGQSTPDLGDGCDAINIWFISDENTPDWIRTLVEELMYRDCGSGARAAQKQNTWKCGISQYQSGWTKGRLNCPKCKNRVGVFDYVSGDRCKCAENLVLPSVQITRSKVDLKNVLT